MKRERIQQPSLLTSFQAKPRERLQLAKESPLPVNALRARLDQSVISSSTGLAHGFDKLPKPTQRELAKHEPKIMFPYTRKDIPTLIADAKWMVSCHPNFYWAGILYDCTKALQELLAEKDD